MHKEDVSKFEESHENITRSFSMLYAGGLLSKRKYWKSRSALGTYSMGTITTKDYLQGKRLSLSGGIPIPKTLSYKDLMFKAVMFCRGNAGERRSPTIFAGGTPFLLTKTMRGGTRFPLPRIEPLGTPFITCDVLFELSELSETLQHHSINIVKVTNVLRDLWEASNHWSTRLEQRWW